MRNSICSQKNFIWCLGGRGLREKQFMTFSLSIKKTKKLSAHRLNILPKQENVYIHWFLCYTIKHAASAERLEQICTLSMRAHVCLTFTAMVRTTELNPTEIYKLSLKYMRTQCINKIYYLHMSHEEPLHFS